MKQKYKHTRFTASSVRVIEHANTIISDYMAQGYTLTLRQLYYQFVSRDLIPNSQKEYKRLGSIVNDARLAGLIDWDAIEDRTRNVRGVTTWTSPASILEGAASQYKIDPWLDQDNYCEVWIEKDALVGVIEPVCNKYRVDYFACRGYTSQSEQRAAGRRFRSKINNDKKVTIFHLGDHDPSGIDMTRDNDDRLNMFIEEFSGGNEFEIIRLALNMDQVRKYKPPPNPAKMTDARFGGYVQNFGNKCWELDALDPKVIGDLIEKNIKSLIDDDDWDDSMQRESAHIEKLNDFIAQAQDMD